MKRDFSARTGTLRTHALRGTTLAETMIAVTVAGFLFSFLGFLTFITTRNTAVLHHQVVAQNSAATAAERIASELRGAVGFERFPADAASPNPLSRVRYVIPETGTTFLTRAMQYDAGTSTVQILDVDGSGNLILPPRHSYRHLSSLAINWESEYRLTLTLGFQYHGFASYHGKSENVQYGQLVTDIIAKNHFMDQGVQNYAQSDNPTSGPATL